MLLEASTVGSLDAGEYLRELQVVIVFKYGFETLGANEGMRKLGATSWAYCIDIARCEVGGYQCQMRGSWDDVGFRRTHEHGYLLTCHELYF